MSHTETETKTDAVEAAEPELKVVPKKRYGQWVASVLALVAAATIAAQLVTNDAFEWNVVGQYLFDPEVLKGVRMTALLTIYSLVLGLTLSVVLALMRLSGSRVARCVAFSYIWFFRGTPLLIQLVFWFNLGALYPELRLGIPFGGPAIIGVDTNDVMTPLATAILGLGLNLAAYMAEVVRAGIIGVDRGQVLAARALGMSPATITRRIVLPQAMRTILPPTGNYVISTFKYTSMASVVSLGELLLSVQTIYSRNFEVIPLLIVASIWYLVLTTILSYGQSHVERYFGRGYGT